MPKMKDEVIWRQPDDGAEGRLSRMRVKHVPSSEALPCKSTANALMTPDKSTRPSRPQVYHLQHKAYLTCLFPDLP